MLAVEELDVFYGDADDIIFAGLGNDTVDGTPVDPATVTVTIATPPAHGTATVNPDGTVTYTPGDNFSGTDRYVYQVCERANPGNCATATVTVTAQPNTVQATDDRAETMQLSPAVRDVPPDKDTLRKLHQTVKKVTEDLDAMRFNTAIAAMMELSNHLSGLEARPRSVLETFVLLLAPFAPHLAEELWRVLGHADTLAYEPWPEADPAHLVRDTLTLAVQVNGKWRDEITVPADAGEEAIQAAALASEKVQRHLGGRTPRRIVVVPGRLVNLVG